MDNDIDIERHPLGALIEEAYDEVMRLANMTPEIPEEVRASLDKVDDPTISRVVATAYHLGRARGAGDIAKIVFDRLEDLVRLISKRREEKKS